MGAQDQIKNLGGILISPRQTIRIISAERKSLLFGLLIVILLSIVQSITFSTLFIITPLTWMLPALPALSGATLALLVVCYVILSVSFWFICSIIVYAFSKLFRGKGSFEDTLLAFSLLWAPSFMLGLVGPILAFLDYLMSIGIYISLFAISFIWGLVLTIIALSEVHSYGIGKAILSIVVPVLLIAVIALSVAMIWW